MAEETAEEAEAVEATAAGEVADTVILGVPKGDRRKVCALTLVAIASIMGTRQQQTR